MKVIISWSYQNAVTYAVFRGWARQSVKIVTEPLKLRGFGPGTEIYFLGPKKLYKFGLYREFAGYTEWLKNFKEIPVTYDDTDNWVSEES